MVDYESVNRGFSKQAPKFDEEDFGNPILQWMRTRTRIHAERFLQPGDRILELNAGTGIDAQYFSDKGYQVHATELSDGMVAQMKRRIERFDSEFSVQQLSFTDLDEVEPGPYDFIFSNFGGLNCAADLNTVSRNIAGIVNPGAYLTLVIMPPVSPWEIGAALKGNFKMAFRRFTKGGVVANIEGEQFRTYYFTPQDVQQAFGNDYKLVAVEGLATFSPPPHKKEFSIKYPGMYNGLKTMDELLSYTFPFNRWADHLIITLQYRPDEPATFKTFGSNAEPAVAVGRRGAINIYDLALPQPKSAYSFLKRSFDVLFSVLFSVTVLWWLMPLIALLVKMDSKGPVFFRQKRTGYLGREFTCLKFRTMVLNENADSEQAENLDPRITRIGAFLRSTNLDELPQFINVIKGDMSVMGPRPHMLKHTTEFSAVIDNYSFRHYVKPGITGLAQVKGWRGPTPNFRSIYKRVQWDIYYVHHQNALMDTYIFFSTIKEVLLNFTKQIFKV